MILVSGKLIESGGCVAHIFMGNRHHVMNLEMQVLFLFKILIRIQLEFH